MMKTTNPGVVMDVRVGHELLIDNGRIRIVVEKKEGQRARLRVIADKCIIVSRPPQEIAVQAA